MFLTEIVFQAVKMKIYTYENVITKVTNKCFYLFGMKMLHNVSEKTHHCFHTCKPHIVYMETRCLYVAVPFFSWNCHELQFIKYKDVAFLCANYNLLKGVELMKICCKLMKLNYNYRGS